MTTVVPQPIRTDVASPPQNMENASIVTRKRKLLYIGLTQIILAVLCFLLGGILISQLRSRYTDDYDEYYYYYRSITLGEGLWASVIPFVAGILAMLTGRQNSNSRCLLQSSMAFSIIGAVSSAVLFSLEIAFLLINWQATTAFRVLISLVTVMAFVNFVLLIVTSVYTCLLLPNCCNCCEESRTVAAGQQVIYIQNTGQTADGNSGVRFVQVPANAQIITVPAGQMVHPQVQYVAAAPGSFTPQQQPQVMTSQPQMMMQFPVQNQNPTTVVTSQPITSSTMTTAPPTYKE